MFKLIGIWPHVAGEHNDPFLQVDYFASVEDYRQNKETTLMLLMSWAEMEKLKDDLVGLLNYMK